MPEAIVDMTLLGPERSLLIRNKFRSVLQMRLQQRRHQEQLATQGALPPLKTSPPASDVSSIRVKSQPDHLLLSKCRAQGSETMHVHFPGDTKLNQSLRGGEATPQAKRLRLAWPSHMREEHSSVTSPPPITLLSQSLPAIPPGHLPHTPEASSLDEDSGCDTFSPEQPSSNGSHTSAPSPGLSHLAYIPSPHAALPGPLDAVPVGDGTPATAAAPSSTTKTPRSSRRNRDAKPKVRMLKYHQYVPPCAREDRDKSGAMNSCDGGGPPIEGSELRCPTDSDSPYGRLLRQQQLYLHLQILEKQQQQGGQQAHSPGSPGEDHEGGGLMATLTRPLSPGRSVLLGDSLETHHRFSSLPPNLDELKVSDLKQLLKARGLPVSGTKPILLERLRLHHHQLPQHNSLVAAGGTLPYSVVTPPISPAAPQVDKSPDALSHRALSSGQGACLGPLVTNGGEMEPGLERDLALQQKRQKIKELQRILESERRQAEELRMQVRCDLWKQNSSEANHLFPMLPNHFHHSPVFTASSPCGDLAIPQVHHTHPFHGLPMGFGERLCATSSPAQTLQNIPPAFSPLAIPRPLVPATPGQRSQHALELSPHHLLVSQPTHNGLHQCRQKYQHQIHHQHGMAKANSKVDSQQVSSTLPPVSLSSRQPPSYEDAVRLTHQQQELQTHNHAIDDLFSMLMENGEIGLQQTSEATLMQSPTPVASPLPKPKSATAVQVPPSRPPSSVVTSPAPPSPLSPSGLLQAWDETGSSESLALEQVLVSLAEDGLSLDMSDEGAGKDEDDWLELGLGFTDSALGLPPMSPALPPVFSTDLLEDLDFDLGLGLGLGLKTSPCVQAELWE
uniref:myocardin-like isoform X1 n=2 Tax=Myxine glutinosa TaxID=7769 RepID=UPI00358FD99C